jgi:hypothetical protein
MHFPAAGHLRARKARSKEGASSSQKDDDEDGA